MGKETTEQKMMTYISKARHYFNGKDFIKAIENFKKAIKIDKPMAKQLGIVGDLDRAEVLLKEQQELPLRGLGVLCIDFLNLKNEFVLKHKMYITHRMKDEFRLPVMVRTRFVKAESVEQLEEEIAILKKSQEKASERISKELNDKITAFEAKKSESDVIIKDLNEKLLKSGESLKKAETKAGGQIKVIEGLEKRVKLLETKSKDKEEKL